MKRSFDAQRLNALINDAEIRPLIGPPTEGPLDGAPLLADPANILLEWAGGLFLLCRIGDGAYELHTLAEKAHRGAPFFRAAAAMFRHLFVQTDCVEILTKCPDGNLGARMAAGIVGFKERFRREDPWSTGEGISYRALTIDDWFIRSEEAQGAGAEFHAALEAAKLARGASVAPHPEDRAHDRAVGAALMMIRAGQTAKGCSFYNRWAAFAGYAPVAWLGPGLVDTQDAIVSVEEARLEVLLLR